MAVTLTPMQADVLRALSVRNTRLRWYSQQSEGGRKGRGKILGITTPLTLIPGYTVRRLIGMAAIDPVDAENRKPFKDGGDYRDYHITTTGRNLVRQQKKDDHPQTKQGQP